MITLCESESLGVRTKIHINIGRHSWIYYNVYTLVRLCIVKLLSVVLVDVYLDKALPYGACLFKRVTYQYELDNPPSLAFPSAG